MHIFLYPIKTKEMHLSCNCSFAPGLRSIYTIYTPTLTFTLYNHATTSWLEPFLNSLMVTLEYVYSSRVVDVTRVKW